MKSGRIEETTLQNNRGHHERADDYSDLCHDIHPVETLLADLPSGARVAGDKGYVSAPLKAAVLAQSGVHLVAAQRANMRPNTPVDAAFIRNHRRTIETVNSQLEAMGLQRLRARTVDDFFIKVHAALLAVACLKLN